MGITDPITPSDTVPRTLVLGAVGGMLAAMVMAMFAMAASATYQHRGFFTPLFHISALFGSSNAMMTSMQQAMAGNRFWFTPGAALAGLAIHMVTGAAYGMMFAAIARVVPRKAVLPAGAIYGLAVFAVSAFVDLPAAASITRSGDAITNMARIVGYPTFAVEHVMYGVALGAFLLATTHRTAPVAAPARTRRTALAA
jgi:hypothetical protein